MNAAAEPQPRRSLLPGAKDMRDLDSIDNCRMRLLTLRTRIEHNWPTAGGRFFNRTFGLSDESAATIRGLLMALPTPLPLQAGQEPQCIISETDTDLHLVSGRAVDAALALLADRTLESRYPDRVTILEADGAGAREPIVVSQPTVGLLVATMIGTLEAISEEINKPSHLWRRPKAAPPQPAAPNAVPPAPQAEASPASKPSSRGSGVPRI